MALRATLDTDLALRDIGTYQRTAEDSTTGFAPSLLGLLRQVHPANGDSTLRGRYKLPDVYTSLAIEHLRGIRRLHLTDLTRINLISGRNNTGKTAILEAFLLHASGPHAGEYAVSILAPSRTGIPSVLDPSGITSPWTSFFFRQNIEDTIRMLGNSDGEEIAVEMAIPRDQKSRAIQQYSQPGQVSPSHSLDVRVKRGDRPARNYVQTAGAQALAPATQLLGGLALQFSGLNLRLEPAAEVIRPAFYMSSRARTPPQELARRYSNLKTRGRDRDFIAAMRIIEPRLKSVEVLINNGQAVLHADIGLGIPLPLPLLGEGTVTLADIITGIFEVRDGIALIDEIDNGIHYSVLADLWFQVGKAARQANVQVFATTHSRECLVAAHLAFRKTPDVLSLLRLQRGEESSVGESVARYDSNTLESALELDLDIR